MSLSTKQSDVLTQISNTNKQYIVGIDEVGYGCIAGPIFVSAFFAPKDWKFNGLRDSKKLSCNQRQEIVDNIINTQKDIIQYTTIGISSFDIDKYGVSNVMKNLYRQTAFIAADCFIDSCLVVIDGILKVKNMIHVSLPKGDDLVPQIMAASIFAKVARDKHMVTLGTKYPQYNWEKNKGYPTSEHLASLKRYGYCEQHRRSYAPVREMVKQ
jgi:ribonuclease HII